MTNASTKAKIVRAVEELPEDASIEDAIERLMLLHKIEKGLQESKAGRTASLDEVERRLQRRRTSRETD